MSKQKVVEVTYDDLPLVCPRPGDEIWNSHPKVMLPIQETGKSKCPYCGTDYVLKDWDPKRKLH
ncbi:zinc-finger domain-containing protein [Thiosulfativibrio zosterae]